MCAKPRHVRSVDKAFFLKANACYIDPIEQVV